MLLAQEAKHGFAHRFADIHVHFGVATVVTVSTATLGHGIGVDGRNIAFELGMLAGRSVHCQMGIEDFPGIVVHALGGFAHGAQNELGIRRIEVLPQGLDQADQVLLVVLSPDGIPGILFPLPEEEASDFILGGTRIILADTPVVKLSLLR